MTSRIALLSTSIVTMSTLVATEETATNAGEPPPVAKLSILALGPKPVRRYSSPAELPTHSKIPHANTPHDGQLRLLAPPAHATPPSQLYLRINEEQVWDAFNVGFNNQTRFKEVRANKALALYRATSHSKSSAASITLDPLVADSTNLLVLTTRSSPQVSWKKRLTKRQIPLSWSATDDTRLILFNASSQIAKVFLGNAQPLVLQPRSQTTIDLSPSANRKLVTFRAMGILDAHVSLQETIKLIPNITKFYAFYDAYPKTNGGRKLGTFRAVYEKPQPCDALPQPPKS